MRTRALALILLACVESLDARVTKIVVEKTETVERTFGKAGQYEILSGHFSGELDPKDPHNQIINDIQLAVRNARGLVEYTGTFAIAKPRICLGGRLNVRSADYSQTRTRRK